MAQTIRLVHWDEDEGLERRTQLEALGFDAHHECGDGLRVVRQIKSQLPDAVVIDLSRIPSRGREVAQSLRAAKYSRHVPIVFVGGDPEKVAKTRQLISDATYTSWGRITVALRKAIAKPVTDPVVLDHHTAWGKRTVEKLGVKAGFTVALLSSPAGFADTLKPWPPKVRLTARADPSTDLFLCFARSARELHAHLLSLPAAARQTLWLLWPKKASGVRSDLDGNVVRTTGLAAGWVDYKVCSVDDTWSGLAFKRRRK